MAHFGPDAFTLLLSPFSPLHPPSFLLPLLVPHSDEDKAHLKGYTSSSSGPDTWIIVVIVTVIFILLVVAVAFSVVTVLLYRYCHYTSYGPASKDPQNSVLQDEDPYSLSKDSKA